MTGTPLIEGVRDLSEIGRGGFGIVYRGTEVEFGRDVAVKVLMRLQDDRAKRRFDRERRAMGAVSDHDNIVTVYRGGVTPDDQPYLVMEYVRAGSLSDRLNNVGPLDWREAANIGAKLADALTVAHRAGILHRDVKPGNVFLTETGEPKLGDFGIAVLDDGQASRTSGITASVAHAPPEIVDGQQGDERSDLYSLASTIYALVNGAAPFSRNTDEGLAALLSRLANEPPRSLHLESAASQFEAVLLKGLSKRPEDRHPTVAEFGNELRRASLVTADIPQPNVPVATAPKNPARPPGAKPPQSEATQTSSAPAAQHVGADSPRREVSMGQMGFLAVLLLAIAAFGGWAVSKAAFGNDAEQATDIGITSAEATAVVGPTVAPTVAAVATAVPAATAVPSPTSPPARIPRPTPAPAPTPTVVPSGEGGGERGATFVPAGFVRIEDNSGAIKVTVPESWAELRYDTTDPSTGRSEVSGRAIGVGGLVRESGGAFDLFDGARSGIYIFAERADSEVDLSALLDLSLESYSQCAMGERSQILLADGNAEYQIMECDHRDGEGTSGVTVFSLVPRDDPNVGVSIALQLADAAEIDALDEILPSIGVITNRIPDPGEFE